MLTLVMVHGANATPDSWNYISAHLTGYKKIFIAYKSQAGFYPNLSDMLETLKGKRNLLIIGHSWGGQYAIHLAKHLGDAVKGIVTIATPFNGSEAAIALNIFKPCQLYADIKPYSKPVTEGHKITVDCPLTAIITTSGTSHLMSAANDGIVTEASMRHRQADKTVDVQSGHYEVMLSPHTVDIIKQAIAEVSEAAA